MADTHPSLLIFPSNVQLQNTGSNARLSIRHCSHMLRGAQGQRDSLSEWLISGEGEVFSYTFNGASCLLHQRTPLPSFPGGSMAVQSGEGRGLPKVGFPKCMCLGGPESLNLALTGYILGYAFSGQESKIKQPWRGLIVHLQHLYNTQDLSQYNGVEESQYSLEVGL